MMQKLYLKMSGETGAQWNTGYSGIFGLSLWNMQFV